MCLMIWSLSRRRCWLLKPWLRWMCCLPLLDALLLSPAAADFEALGGLEPVEDEAEDEVGKNDHLQE